MGTSVTLTTSAQAHWGEDDEVQAEEYAVPSGTQREKRPRGPGAAIAWTRWADSMNAAFGLTYGQEHLEERMRARQRLYDMHEQDKHRMPRDEMEADWLMIHREPRGRGGRRLTARVLQG